MPTPLCPSFTLLREPPQYQHAEPRQRRGRSEQGPAFHRDTFPAQLTKRCLRHQSK